MQSLLLDMLRCPADGRSLRCTETAAEWIESAELLCTCGKRYRINGGIAYLYVDDEHWAPKAREAHGWVQLFKDTGGYIDDPDDYLMPDVGRPPWLEIAGQFAIALKIAALQPGMRVLDLGAARGWAARRFAQQGCITIALDVVDDPLVGVGRALTLAQHDGSVINPIVADGEQLPFAPGSFDLVFCSATLHHATNLPLLLKNIQRVLRPGGLLIAINEPVIPDSTTEAAELARADAARETAYGINETRPHLHHYISYLRAAELQIWRVFPWQTYTISLEDMRIWAQQLGIAGPDAVVTRNRPQRGWFKRQPALPDAEMIRRMWGDYLLQTIGGAAIIVAKRAEETL